MNVYMQQPPAWFSPRILVGPGEMLTARFVRDNRITHVINCAQDDFCPRWWKQQHPDKYVVLNAIDSLQHNILDWFPAFEYTLRMFLRDGPLDGVVYVHCQAGMNRSASLALAYVCKNHALPLNMVVAAVRRQRPCILQNPVFMRQVREFINHGCFPSAENTRLDVDRVHDRDLGLFASEHRAGIKRFQNPAAVVTRGAGWTPL
jgi:hypothetical protein